MITSIIFSKDRALQLDLTLKSVRQNFLEQNNISVLYKASEDYVESYQTLQDEYPDVVFHQQGHSIFQDINHLVSKSEDDYIVFFTDDDIFYSKIAFTYDNMDWLFNEIDISCLALRMGNNTTLREIDGVTDTDSLPDKGFVVGDQQEGTLGNQAPHFMVWNRMTVPPGGYWAYALSVDGHIFKKETLAPLCAELLCHSQYYEYKSLPRSKERWNDTPNEFETKLQRFYFEVPAFMSAPMHSCVVNSPNNRVQSHIENNSGTLYPLSLMELDQHFKQGKRLKLDKMNFSDINCPHTEINIIEGLE